MMCCYISTSYRSSDIEWNQNIFIFFFPTAKLMLISSYLVSETFFCRSLAKNQGEFSCLKFNEKTFQERDAF